VLIEDGILQGYMQDGQNAAADGRRADPATAVASPSAIMPMPG